MKSTVDLTSNQDFSGIRRIGFSTVFINFDCRKKRNLFAKVFSQLSGVTASKDFWLMRLKGISIWVEGKTCVRCGADLNRVPWGSRQELCYRCDKELGKQFPSRKPWKRSNRGWVTMQFNNARVPFESWF